MNCFRCGKELNSRGMCNCGFNFLSAPVILTSEITESSLASLTGYGMAHMSSERDAEQAAKRNVCTYWGPRRQTYTMAKPARHPVFNSITDNAAVGDERGFVRIVERGTKNEYRFQLDIEPNKQYVVYIYYHNDASATYNDKQHGYAGVAREVRLATDFPNSLGKGEKGLVHARICASNTDPKEVWAGAYVTATEDVTLHYIEGSAKIWNAWNRTGTVLSTRIFSPDGTYIGLKDLNGVILGCDEFSGSIRYMFMAKPAHQRG